MAQADDLAPELTFCPICGGRRFENFKGRPQVRCAQCGSLERHRQFAALALDRLSGLKGRKIHLVKSGDWSPVTRMSPNLFKVIGHERLAFENAISALFLRRQFEQIGLPVDQFFSQMRRKIAPDGFIAFCYLSSAEPPDYEGRNVQGSEGATRLEFHFGPSALEWFSRLPGWSFRVWQPHSTFGNAAEKQMRLRYRNGQDLSSRILLAEPTG